MTETLTRREAADFLRISVRTLDRLRLPSMKAGRRTLFFKSELVAYLEGNRINHIETPKVVYLSRKVKPARRGPVSPHQDTDQRHLDRLRLLQAA